jgi:hypothetical protein
MTPIRSLALGLLVTAAPTVLYAQDAPQRSAASAQPADDAELEDEEGGEEIVVQGQRPRGSVIGDIPAENVLNTRDIRATGATSISELLDAVATQTGSARGRGAGRPVLLLNGQRISGFRELRDLPPEAIERMEILPEEVALKYGYAADQRVVNIVLRRRFNSTTAEARGRAATDGGYVSGQVESSRLIIAEGKRTSLAVKVAGNSALGEDERDILLQPLPGQPTPLDPRSFRTLVGSGREASVTATANRNILGDVSATVTAEASTTRGRTLFGVPGTLSDIDGDIIRAFDGDPLVRRTTTNTIGLGSALNVQKGKWRLSSTANAELSRSTSRSDRGFDLTAFQNLIDTGDPAFDPFGDLGPLADLAPDRGRSVRRSLSLDGTANGPLFALPGGDASVTFRAGGSSIDLDSRSVRSGAETPSDLGRDTLEGSASVDLPITRRASAIGRLSLNANAGVSHLSDFGTLTSFGAGVNWGPAPRLNLLASWTREEGAPSLNQLGDPELVTPGVRFFDFTNGQTVSITTRTGGNEDLLGDRRNVFKLGGNWQPVEKVDLRLRGEFVHERIDNPQASFPAASPALEDAFPTRFERDGDDNLVSVDLRPVNFDQSRRSTLRLGFDFTKPIASKRPTAAQIAALRDQFRRQAQRDGVAPPAPPATPPAEGAGQGEGRRVGGGGFGGGGGGGGRFGGRNGGRLTFSLTDTITLQDQVTIAPGLPKLDYLDGDAKGGGGGQARHRVEAQAGYYNNGLGARLSANWRSGTSVRSGAGDLDFSPYATFDLRLFANLGERIDLVTKHPFFRGASVRFEINNIFNSRPEVRNSAGDAPINYQPGLIEPIGRTVGISFRKLFIPRQFFRQGGGFGGGGRGAAEANPPPPPPPPGS